MTDPRKLPPLNALRAFEAAARHLSFTKAAEELHVTPGAVSQQVKALEEYLGLTLFRRLNRALTLTEEAENCLPTLRLGFDKLSEATQLLTAREAQNRLSVSAAPSFTSKWLIPRLGSFQQDHPDIDVWISADMELADFARDEIDVAIRYGTGAYHELHAERLLTESVFPVCSPDLLTGSNPLKTPEDLAHYTLLHDSSPDHDESCPDWPMWLKASGAQNNDGTRGLRFNQSGLVLEAAISGRGVALAKSTLAQADLIAGRLAKPFNIAFPIEFAYYMVCPPAKLSLPKVQQFMAWLRHVAGRAERAN